MNVEIIIPADGFGHFASAIDTYIERMRQAITLVPLRPEKSEDSVVVIRKETERIREYLMRRPAYTILCDERGRTLDTRMLDTYLTRHTTEQGRIRFIIGGSYGVDREALGDLIHDTLSLGTWTLPHALATLVLVEQLYRVDTIRRGSGYHH